MVVFSVADIKLFVPFKSNPACQHVFRLSKAPAGPQEQQSACIQGKDKKIKAKK